MLCLSTARDRGDLMAPPVGHWQYYIQPSTTTQILTTVQTVNSCTSRPDVLQCLVVKIICQKRKPSTPMTHVTCEPKLHSALRSCIHPCPGNWVAIGCVVVYYARAAHAFSAGIRYQPCSLGVGNQH